MQTNVSTSHSLEKGDGNIFVWAPYNIGLVPELISRDVLPVADKTTIGRFQLVLKWPVVSFGNVKFSKHMIKWNIKNI